MSLNKARKRLIRKYRGLYNSRLLGLKIKTADDKKWSILSPTVEDFDANGMILGTGVIDASFLSGAGISLEDKEITISFGLSKKGNRKLREALRGY